MRTAIVVVVLFLANPAFANEYLFVGYFGQIYSMQDDGKVEMIAPPFLYRSGIEECMYSIDKGEIAVNIIDMDWRMHTFGAESRITGKYSMNIHRGNFCDGIFYNHKEQTIATALVRRESADKRRHFGRNRILLMDEKSTDSISNIDSYLSINTGILRAALPNGEFDRDAFSSSHNIGEKQIKRTGKKWLFVGQSRRWLCYDTIIKDKVGEPVENASWIKDKITESEHLYIRDGEQGRGSVYPDVVLFKITTRLGGSARSPLSTGKYQVQLPNESTLREFEIDPAARHLWANSKSIFYQLNSDVMRFDYTDASSKTVKIWEPSDHLVYMFEKDSILNALKEESSPSDKERTP